MDITGKFKTEHGELELSMEGSKITGVYADNIGVLEGEIKNNIVSGVWRKPTLGNEGLFQFTFTNEQTFSGVYKSGIEKGVLRGKWNGIRIDSYNTTFESEKIIETINIIEQETQLTNELVNKTPVNELKDSNGNIFLGDFLNEKLHGKGKMIDKDGDVFEGDWINGEFVKGKIIFTDGSIEEGHFKDFELHGSGKANFIDEDGIENIMEGHYEDGEFIEGKHTYLNQRIEEGYFTNFELNGKGRITYHESGDVYEGEFLDGLLNGEGKIYSNGELSDEGYFVDGLLNGEGKRYFNGKLWQEGYFVNNRLNGIGKAYLQGKLSREGEFKKGWLNGIGKKYFDGELCYEGEFKEDDLNGIGKWYIDGKLFKYGKFENGSFIGSNSSNSMNTEFNEIPVDENIKKTKILLDNAKEKEKEAAKKVKELQLKAKENEATQKEKEKEAAKKVKELQLKAKEKEAAQKEKELQLKAKEKEKALAQQEKNKNRYFNIDYSIKLTQAKTETVVKGSVFGSFFGYDKMRFADKKTHDKGQTIQRSIKVQHAGQNMPNNIAKHHIEQNDIDVKSGRAGTSTIVILKIKES
jgi:hypothetical protein